MAFDRNGLALGSDRATIGTGKGSTKRSWSYFTNDARTAVETNGYFDDGAEDVFQNGDIVHVSFDVDGTPGGRSYVAVVTAGDVALTPFYETPA